MMKILYCIPSLSESGGTERIVTQKINYLLGCNDAYDITVVTTEGIGRSSFYSLNPKTKIIELNINFLEEFNKPLHLKYFGTKNKLKDYKKKLTEIITEHQIDICVSTGAKELEFFSKLKVECKKICELHFSKNNRRLFLERKKGIIWKILGNLRTADLIRQTKKLDRLVVLTKKDKMDWIDTNTNITQIYNFSDFQSSNVATLDIPKVISVGRLTNQKGYEYLIKAWSILEKKGINWTLEIYGEGELHSELTKQIEANNLKQKVFLKGQTNAVQEKILESSIFALSSRYEGFPMVLLESMACGVPLVSFDCETGPAEIIENDDCGILVENRNVEKLAEALIVMIGNTNLRKEKGRIAKIKFDQFSKEKIMKEWMDLFDSLLNERN